MYECSSSLLLRWLKVPAEPHPPHGDPASLRVFRAGKNLFNLRLASWAFGQVLALAGIIFWLVIFVEVEGQVQDRRRSGKVPARPTDEKSFNDYVNRIANDQKESEAAIVAPAAGATPVPAVTPAPADGSQVKPATPATTATKAKPKRPRVRITGWAGFKRMLVEIGLVLPLWSFPLLWVLKSLGFAAYLIQLPLTYAVRRLDYELRWYMVTDRSLRIRHGVWKVSESTMSFANIQQVVVTQGPLQRVLGLSDVKVLSAGGGGESDHPHAGGDDDMHLGLFHGVTNGSEIRDLILDRLRHFRESGLGDPDEKNMAPVAMTAPAVTLPTSSDTLAAARELAAEARALRVALS
jgi:membrane protein YdbS with pleckstrin-like domain